MQVFIFTSLKDRQFLQDAMDFASYSNSVKFQMFFTDNKKQILSLVKQKHDLIVTNEKSVAALLKRAGYKGLLMKNWSSVTKEFKYGI